MSAVLRSSILMPEKTALSAPETPVCRRYLALWLPFLPIDRFIRRFGKQDERPLVLVEKHNGALRLGAVDAAATRAGLRTGMNLAQARALVPALLSADLDRARDREMLLHCARAALRFTPLVALDGDDGLLLDITGCAHLFGGESGLMKAACLLMRRVGLGARPAVASTPEAAHAFARHTQGGVISPGSERSLARRLPVQALEADAETTRALMRAGLKTLDDLAIRPSATLTARFGDALTTRLGCILGDEDRRIVPLRSPPDIMAERHFPEPLGTLDGLFKVLGRLASDVAGCLERRGEGGRAFEATFFRSDGDVRSILIETAEPTRASKTLIRLFNLRIETVSDPLDPGFGFDALRLSVLCSDHLALRQDSLIEEGAGTAGQGSVTSLVDRLGARFGPDSVRRLAAQATHDPARAATSVRFESAADLADLPALEQDEPPSRPLTLFERPQPVDATAEVPDGPPIQFRWRRILHEVARAEGPERIAPEWWRPEHAFPAIRDYYRVEDAGGARFWVFREGFFGQGSPPRWYVHGVFA